MPKQNTRTNRGQRFFSLFSFPCGRKRPAWLGVARADRATERTAFFVGDDDLFFRLQKKKDFLFYRRCTDQSEGTPSRTREENKRKKKARHVRPVEKTNHFFRSDRHRNDEMATSQLREAARQPQPKATRGGRSRRAAAPAARSSTATLASHGDCVALASAPRGTKRKAHITTTTTRAERTRKTRARLARPRDARAATALASSDAPTDTTKAATIDDLPDELLALIMARVPCLDRLYGGAASVCRHWRGVALYESAYAAEACCQGSVRKMDPYASAVDLFHVDCIEYALARGHTQTADACAAATARGRFDLALWFSQHGAKWKVDELAVAAASSGRVQVIEAMCEAGAARSDARVCAAAAAGGHLPCIEYARATGFVWNEAATKRAASGGHIDCLVYLHRHGCPWDERATAAALDPKSFKHRRSETDADVCASLDARLTCLRYLIANGCAWDNRALVMAAFSGARGLALALDLGHPMDEDAGEAVVYARDVTSVPLLTARGYKWTPSDMYRAIECGEPKMIDALLTAGVSWQVDMATHLARHGRVDLMRWAIDRGLAWNIESCLLKAVSSDGALYRWIIETGYDCPRHAKFCLRAAKHRRHKAIEYLLKHGFPWDPVAGVAFIPKIDSYCLAVLVKAGLVGAGPCKDSAVLCQLAARHDPDHDGCATLTTLYAQGHRGDARATASAAGRGCLQTLRWLVDRGCPVNDGTVFAAAGGGHVDCLRYLCETGHACDVSVYYSVIHSGSVACLAYLEERRCPRPHDAVLCAVRYGWIDSLRYLHEESGVPLHPYACLQAVHRGSVACLRYAHKRGCKIDLDKCMAALRGRHWARVEEGCARYLAAQRDAAKAPPSSSSSS
ncbi:F-box domain containing protein [Pandoravirus japonicus]|uniref:F-box domain containing protein n=1 Tax=Pandoravirus japonicus TaxID=2823154 RepID=A0A811BMH9_9VIRU|nr:F-box domain containing protein [Pandoravirus japonicus]